MEQLKRLQCALKISDSFADQIGKLWSKYYAKCGFITDHIFSLKDIGICIDTIELGSKCKKFDPSLASKEQSITFAILDALGAQIDELNTQVDTAVYEKNFGEALKKCKEKIALQKSLIAQLKAEIEKQHKRNEPVPATEPKREKQNTL